MASLGLAIVSTLAFFGKAGQVGELFSSAAKSLFGWGIFLVPLGLTLLGVAFLKSISRKIYISAIIGTALFVLGFLAVFHILGNGDLSIRLHQGGYLGLIIGLPILKAVGFTSSFVVLVVLLFVSVLVALNIPVHKLILRKKEENADGDEETPTLKDNVVIKRGTQVITPAMQKAEELQRVNQKPETRNQKPETAKGDEDKEFVIRASKSGKWVLPPIEILNSDKDQPRSGDINANVTIIKRTLSNFGIDVEMGEVSIGPAVTQFTLRPAVGVKLAKITTLRNDLELALAAHPIRIEAPIPGKALVGIEVPNKKSAIVGLRDMFESDEFKKSRYLLPVAVGRDVAGFPIFAGLEKMPHILIAGATGTGKSVAINTLLLSLLYKHSPDILKFIMVDPKRVELSLYNGIPHLVTPVITDGKKVVNALRWAVREMEKRYERLSSCGSRDINSFNIRQAAAKDDLMPFIVIVIDELADLMAAHGRDVEAAIVRLAQMARAVGIHLVASTQRPSVEVITGLIKANITSRVALQVVSQVDSRTILDMSGAEKLLGNGDMLYLAGDVSKPRRIQGSFVSEKEVKDVVKFVKQQAEQLEEAEGEEEKGGLEMDIDEAVSGATLVGEDSDMGDALFNDAKEVVAQAGKASASLLQRRLRVGYARAARLLDLLEESGIIGPGEGAKPREVYIGKGGGVPPVQDNYVDDGSVAEVASADSKLDDKIATEE
ncbi:MAG: DNA translocase FtsK 4TM domain-containing protein [Candidatus Yanofskybacteria bacterium]|nr:DNA translocase FtsK 4TM domain-containing protein [Candidatus Yanofskybacteria bacterium]